MRPSVLLINIIVTKEKHNIYRKYPDLLYIFNFFHTGGYIYPLQIWNNYTNRENVILRVNLLIQINFNHTIVCWPLRTN